MYFSFSISLVLAIEFAYLIFLGNAEGASNYFGKFLGSLKSYHHALAGDVYVVDSRTLHIRNFNYDGEGPAGYFYVSNTKTPNENGIKLRDERGSAGPLKRYRKRHITLTLPEGKNINNFKWFYVWCDEFSVNFGDVKIPKNLDFPKPQKISRFSGVHDVSSDNVVVVDAQTLLIPSFSYDGEAPDAKFWIGSGNKPTPQGVRVADENGKEDPLRKYDKKTIVLTLPGDITVFDIGNFAIWCEAFTVDFGHIQIPKNLNVPPSLKMLGVSPQKFTRSILSHLNLEFPPYSLYSELSTEANSWMIQHSYPNAPSHNIKIRNTLNDNNNNNNVDVSGVGRTNSSAISTDSYIYIFKIVTSNENVIDSYNCTRKNSSLAVEDNFNINNNSNNVNINVNSSNINNSNNNENSTNDCQSDTREVLEADANLFKKPDVSPIKLVENRTNCNYEVHLNDSHDYRNGNERTMDTFKKGEDKITNIFNYVELVKLLRNETAVKISNLFNITTSSESSITNRYLEVNNTYNTSTETAVNVSNVLDITTSNEPSITSRYPEMNNKFNTSTTNITTAIKPLARLEEDVTESSIEIIKSISTEYKELIDNKNYEYGSGNDYSGSGFSNNIHDKSVIYHKENSSPTVSKIIDLTKKSKKVHNKNYVLTANKTNTFSNRYNNKNRNQNLVNKLSDDNGFTTVGNIVDVGPKNENRYSSNSQRFRNGANFKNANNGYSSTTTRTVSIKLNSPSSVFSETGNMVNENRRRKSRNKDRSNKISSERFHVKEKNTNVNDINALWSWNTPSSQSTKSETFDITGVNQNQFSFNKLN